MQSSHILSNISTKSFLPALCYSCEKLILLCFWSFLTFFYFNILSSYLYYSISCLNFCVSLFLILFPGCCLWVRFFESITLLLVVRVLQLIDLLEGSLTLFSWKMFYVKDVWEIICPSFGINVFFALRWTVKFSITLVSVRIKVVSNLHSIILCAFSP